MNHLNGAGGAPIVLAQKIQRFFTGRKELVFNREYDSYVLIPRTPAMLMSYCGRRTLDEVLKYDSYEDLQLLEILFRLGRQLQEIHNLGVVHNDLKMNNIVLSDDLNPEDGLPKSIHIIDYGLACANRQSLNCVAPTNICPWMAPEVKAGRCSTFAGDVYSFGIIIKDFLRVLKGRYMNLKILADMATYFQSTHRISLSELLIKLDQELKAICNR